MDSTYMQKVRQRVEQAKEEGRAEYVSSNGLDYVFITEPDDWISILLCIDGGYRPYVQSSSRAGALDYIATIEPVPAYFERI